MNWTDLAAAWPDDESRALRDRIAGLLQGYGGVVLRADASIAELVLPSGGQISWQFSAQSYQRFTLDPNAAEQQPEALRNRMMFDIRRVSDLSMLVALLEDPFRAALLNRLAILREKFPDWTGFGVSGDRFDAQERDYKLSAGQTLKARLIAPLSDTEILDVVGDAAKATNLLDWRTKNLVSPITNREEQGRLYRKLLADRNAPERHPQVLAEFMSGWVGLNPGARPEMARQIGTYLLFLSNPEEACFFKARLLRDCYMQTYAKPFPELPPEDAYIEELSLAKLWRDGLKEAGYPPRDLLDIQSFIFVTADEDASPPLPAPIPLMPVAPIRSETPMQPLNTILFGPPGTGKTYRTFREAVAICDGAEAADALSAPELRARYEALRAEGRIGFVTFHQSYSYEDFVEGLRPEGGDGEAGFHLAPKAGVLREIAALAASSPDTAADPQDIQSLRSRAFWKMSLGAVNSHAETSIFEQCLEDNLILLGYGKNLDWSDPRFSSVDAIQMELARLFPQEDGLDSHARALHRFRNELAVGDYIIASQGKSAFRAIGRVVGPYRYVEGESDYAQGRPVEWLWHGSALPRSQITSGAFNMMTLHRLKSEEIKFEELAAFLRPRRGPPTKPYVLVMDEINRANVSKVFGELITLLEEDKRTGKENAISVLLPYSGEDFSLPPNLHFLGTMNTADRSIALLDTALRRRFDFVEMAPRPDLLAVVEGIDMAALLSLLNARIEYLADRDHLIGHAFFMGCKTRADLDRVMRRKILPLLAEYFHEDWALIVAALGGTRQGFIACEALPLPPGLELGSQETRWRYTIRDSFAAEAYAGLQS